MNDGAIKIDKNFPPPFSGKARKYPFRDMEIGDSFFAEIPVSRLSQAAHNNRQEGRKYTSRTVTENGVKGTRIWRIS